jgi:hypothetical protein
MEEDVSGAGGTEDATAELFTCGGTVMRKRELIAKAIVNVTASGERGIIVVMRLP